MKKLVLLLITFSCAISAAAYTRITVSGGISPKWQTMPITYQINERGLSQIANGSEFAAVRASFQTWQDVSPADISFDYRGTTTARSVGKDGINLISFADDTAALGSSTLAATYSFFTSGGAVVPEADIIFNNSFSWTTSGETGKYDVQAVLTHEIGHFLGLDHSALISSVMVPFASPNQIDQRVLQYDDIAGVTEMYPRAGVNPSTGQIRGSVMAGTVAVFGAHVVAVNRDGSPVVSTLTLTDGSYLLRFLPAGDYRVYVEPLDLPVSEQNLGGYYQNVKKDFGTTYLGDVTTLGQARTIQVAASSVATGMDIHVFPKSATSLNLTRPAFAPRIPLGSTGTLSVSGVDLSAGALFTTSNTALTLGGPTYSTSGSSTSPTSAAIPLAVSPSTPLGPKNIAVNRGTDAAVLSGAIVVINSAPSGISLQPAFGPASGGTGVTISGANFRTGARVYFGGLAASDVRFVDSRTLQAVTPANSPGPVNVQVVNSDGVGGVASGAFNFLTQPPMISRVDPLSGPPTTTVLIEGAQFDPRTQNVEVRFNGAPARVISSTASTIQAVVPYGATSGSITVTIFGQTAPGPIFTVVAPPLSTNVAPSSYRFIDASASGGGATLTFTSSDDGVAGVDLPFNFSLFRDIYLAGSRISVTTNGWLSLESVGTAEYQNGALPGQTVAHPSGSTGTTPNALIAPFFDDLVMIPGVSSISTRVAGSAPNRQFIVQWSRMSIFDEEGRDLNASLTFELVLFEGSNDIQFAYSSMSGPRSDASSATIGLQDARRQTGVQTGFNEPIVRSDYFVTYRFSEGQYSSSASTADPTPPTQPDVLDTGIVTNSSSELSASWNSQDAESAIVEYEYAIGTSPGSADVRAFTKTVQSSVVSSGLALQSGVSYFFSVRARNSAGLVSESGVSDGIRFDAAYQGQKQYIPYAPTDVSGFSGIALQAPSAMTVTLRAFDSSGNMITGTNVKNPAIVNLAAGQQSAKLVSELFNVTNFKGWIEAESSGTGLGVFVATGTWDMNELDGTVSRSLADDFVASHPGSTIVLANPSFVAATVSITPYGLAAASTITVPARGSVQIPVAAASRFRSSQPLAAIESLESGGRLAVIAVEPSSAARDSFLFPHAVIGAGYSSMLTLTNTLSVPSDATVTFMSSSRTVRVEANSSRQISVADFLGMAPGTLLGGALRVTSTGVPTGVSKLIATLDILNSVSCVFLVAPAASTNVLFPQVANGNGLFTGLAIATGDAPASITIEVYPASGGVPRTSTFTLGANTQIAKLVTELVSGVSTQVGGYIRIRSDQPVWTLEIYGSDLVMAVAPPI